MSMPVRGARGCYREEMGPMRPSSAWKRGNASVQPSGSEASRYQREDPERCLERPATKRTCETRSLSRDPSSGRIFSDPRGERVDHARGTVDGLGRQEEGTDSVGRLSYFFRERDATSS